MRIIITIDGRHGASLLENEAVYSLGRTDRVETLDISDKSLDCRITKETAQKLIGELQWLLTDPKDPD